MKMSCEIVKDLLPLYHDEVCSDQSRIAVEEHLLVCDTCKKYLESMSGDFIQSNTEKSSEQAKHNILEGIRKKLLKKNIMISAISVICAFTVLIGGFLLIFQYQMPIQYKTGLVSVKPRENEMIDVLFNGDDYYCSYSLTTLIDKEGTKQFVTYIYYTDTIWTKYFSKPQKDKDYKYSINNSSWIDYGDGGGEIEIKKDISAVYYLDYSNIAKLSKEELLKNSSQAILLWEK
jgi:hypothetical protein